MWRGNELGSSVTRVLQTGWVALDSELPGGGWPCHSITEILQPQPLVCELRLLGPTLRSVTEAGKTVVLIGPPKQPHMPGLKMMGLDERNLIWIQADAPSQRLWVTEQLVKSNACGALIAWLPQARQEQIRRLQICSQISEGPVFLCRPATAQHEASAAPLRVQLNLGLDWELKVHVFKRKGPAHEGILALPSIPAGMDSLISPRLRRPSELLANREEREAISNALGRTAPGQPAVRRAPAH
ncbi:translesion DNA synthesis-associated protein ImuA [Aquabacterium sp.]|uniref:translesion DNA synthesis-associated protein ImuA n=1 Tax=Aquabacterium sp. TaxID=1872578 RepID=UPI002489EE06|nr:translesion DNA synthesis-associated protein ImuA [Aquabacterium sp.]MDI1258287.1 translesion DNA synthesis-associated protein ImuA [Aquabacterium sp.]